MLSNAYFLAKFRFDTAENEPARSLKFAKFANFADFADFAKEVRSDGPRVEPGGRGRGGHRHPRGAAPGR